MNVQHQIEVIDRITLGRRARRGHDWESDRYLLAESPGVCLFWWCSGKSWGSLIDGYTHRPGVLMLSRPSNFDDGPPRHTLGQTLHEGGRLSKRLLAEHADAIDAAFGCEVSKHLHPRKTVLVGGGLEK